jgi:hypothetical protein
VDDGVVFQKTAIAIVTTMGKSNLTGPILFSSLMYQKVMYLIYESTGA